MNWTAQDWTLLISALANAVAITAGLLLPFLSRKIEKSSIEKKARLDKLETSIHFCIFRLNQIASQVKAYEIEDVGSKVTGKFIEIENEKIEELVHQFKGHINTVWILCAELEIDDSAFKFHCMSVLTGDGELRIPAPKRGITSSAMTHFNAAISPLFTLRPDSSDSKVTINDAPDEDRIARAKEVNRIGEHIHEAMNAAVGIMSEARLKLL